MGRRQRQPPGSCAQPRRTSSPTRSLGRRTRGRPLPTASGGLSGLLSTRGSAGAQTAGPGYCSWPTGVSTFRHRRPKVPQLRRPLIATRPSFLSSNLSKSLGAELTRLRKLMGTKVGGLYQLHLRDDPIQADNAEHIPWLGMRVAAEWNKERTPAAVGKHSGDW